MSPFKIRYILFCFIVYFLKDLGSSKESEKMFNTMLNCVGHPHYSLHKTLLKNRILHGMKFFESNITKLSKKIRCALFFFPEKKACMFLYCISFNRIDIIVILYNLDTYIAFSVKLIGMYTPLSFYLSDHYLSSLFYLSTKWC